MKNRNNYLLWFCLFCSFVITVFCISAREKTTATVGISKTCPDCGVALVKSGVYTTIKTHSETYANMGSVKCFKGSVKCLENTYESGGQTLAYESAMCDYYSKDSKCRVDYDKYEVIHDVKVNDGFVDLPQVKKTDIASGDIKCVIYYCPSCKYAIPVIPQ